MRHHILETIDPQKLGQRLQAARRARRLTQQETAAFLGVARAMVTALEQGARRIRPDELIRLADLYDRTVSEFVGAREPIPDFTAQFRAAIAGADTEAAPAGIGTIHSGYAEALRGLPVSGKLE